MYIGISRETVYQWSKDEEKKDFSDIVRVVDEEREISLIDKALLNQINPQITKLLLSQIDIIEKKEIKQDINILENLSDDELERQLKDLED